MVIDQRCAEGCDFDENLGLGEGAFCSEDRDEVEEAAPDADANSDLDLETPTPQECPLPGDSDLVDSLAVAHCVPNSKAVEGHTVCDIAHLGGVSYSHFHSGFWLH